LEAILRGRSGHPFAITGIVEIGKLEPMESPSVDGLAAPEHSLGGGQIPWILPGMVIRKIPRE
jgi:hypothetical protein